MTASTDSSRRFVLPPEAPLLRNLAAMWAYDPALAGRIEAVADPYPVEPSKSGVPCIALRVENRAIYLHSRYEPLDEARRLIENINFEQKMAYFVHGLGLGYHLELIFEKASEEAIFCVLEPDLRLIRTALEQRDLSKMIESRRLLFFDQVDKGDLFGRLTPRTALISMGVECVIHPPSLQLAGEFHKQMQTWITEFVTCCRTSLNTLVLNGRRTAENLAFNAPWYVSAPGVLRLKDRYRKLPAIIVSAGPSLRKNKHLLKNAAGKAVLIAVQTTLQPLLEMGVVPTFATSLDYHEVCTQFFEKLPKGLPTELVAEPKASSAVFKLNAGPLTLLGNEFVEGLLREMRINKDRLRAGATVAHLAYYLAEHMGCDPIIFVGQDLGFGDGLCYTPGTSYEDVWRPELSRFCSVEMKQWEQIVRDRQILRKITDQQGRPMYTEERLYSYLQQFERDFAQTSTRIIDATEGGALKRGATVMTLASAIEQYCTKPLRKVADDHPGLQWHRMAECRKSLENRCDESEQIAQIADETLPMLEEVRDHLDDQSRVNRLIARIDRLRARMDQLGDCYDLILQLTQLSELKRFQQDRRIAAARMSAMERQRRQTERDIENVRSIGVAARQFTTLIRQVIESMPAGEQREVA